MAQRCLSGIDGGVTLPTGHAAKLRAWSLVVNQEVADCSGFSSTSDWREALAGMKSWSGVASGYVEFDAASTAPNAHTPVGSGSITLTVGSGCTYAGTVIITSISVSQSIDGVASIAFSFVGNGALTETWDEAA